MWWDIGVHRLIKPQDKFKARWGWIIFSQKNKSSLVPKYVKLIRRVYSVYEYADINWDNSLNCFNKGYDLGLLCGNQDSLDSVQVKWSLFREKAITQEADGLRRFPLQGSTQPALHDLTGSKRAICAGTPGLTPLSIMSAPVITPRWVWSAILVLAI